MLCNLGQQDALAAGVSVDCHASAGELYELAEVLWHEAEGLRHGEYLVHARDAATPGGGQHVGLEGAEDDEQHAV